jgi:hypothetical protein
MHNTKSDGTGVWSTFVFPFLNKGALAASPLSDDVAVAMYNSGGVSYPVMVVSSSAGVFGIKAAQLNPMTGDWTDSTPATVDTIAAGIEKLAIDSDGTNIALAYYDVSSTKIKMTYTSNGGLSWAIPVYATNAGIGQGPSIKLSGGIPSIAYWSKSGNNVYYAQCNVSTLAGCVGNGSVPWGNAVQVNPSTGNNLGVSGMNAASDQFLSTSINFDSSGNAYVYYPIGYGTTLTPTPGAGLAVAVGAANGTGTFTQSLLYTAANSWTAASPLAGAGNYALAGQQVSTVRNSITGVPIAAFNGPGNWLYATSCGD